MPTAQPIGHESQMPIAPRKDERINARRTRRMRSENVEIMNGIMSPEPLITASVMIFTPIII